MERILSHEPWSNFYVTRFRPFMWTLSNRDVTILQVAVAVWVPYSLVKDRMNHNIIYNIPSFYNPNRVYNLPRVYNPDTVTPLNL